MTALYAQARFTSNMNFKNDKDGKMPGRPAVRLPWLRRLLRGDLGRQPDRIR